jgi:Mor family transcriptional regulator
MAVEKITMTFLREIEMFSDSEGRYIADLARVYAPEEFKPET